MNYNILYREDEALEILNEVNAHMFQNRDGSINQQVLGMYVHEWGADRVVMKDNKLLICKTIEEARYEEI
jgi:hypothetical protein|tara:strand:+ start:250 stop:459 length:210 start_codon:yes stop_codon:yes gene_type:complete